MTVAEGAFRFFSGAERCCSGRGTQRGANVRRASALSAKLTLSLAGITRAKGTLKPVRNRDRVAGSFELTTKLDSMNAIQFPLSDRLGLCVKICCAAGALVLASNRAHASIAYGTINNFDTVNDTSNVCHGFEIEIDDCRSADITYCYSYNHYGTPN